MQFNFLEDCVKKLATNRAPLSADRAVSSEQWVSVPYPGNGLASNSQWPSPVEPL
jgi:hypothetical protein